MVSVQWIVNVCFSVIGRDFSDFIRGAIEARNEGVA